VVLGPVSFALGHQGPEPVVPFDVFFHTALEHLRCSPDGIALLSRHVHFGSFSADTDVQHLALYLLGCVSLGC
jgi:hypothetical protein